MNAWVYSIYMMFMDTYGSEHALLRRTIKMLRWGELVKTGLSPSFGLNYFESVAGRSLEILNYKRCLRWATGAYDYVYFLRYH